MRFSDPEKDAVEVPVRFSKRAWVIFLGIPLLLLGLVAAVWLYYAVASDTELEKALAAADRQDPNWRLEDIEATRAIIPDEQNGALVIFEVDKLLPNNWTQLSKTPIQSPGPPPELHERFEDHPVEMRLRADQIEALTEALENVEPALIRARTLLRYPKGRHAVAWAKNGISTLLPSTQNTRKVVDLLGYDALLRAEENDLQGAWDSCQAAFHAGRTIGDEPTIISQLVRIACRSIAVGKVERILAQGQLANETLARMQRVLEEEAEEPLFYYGMRGERALAHRTMTALESGELSMALFKGLSASGSNPRTNLEEALAYFSYKSAHAYVINYLTECVEMLKPPDGNMTAIQAKGRTAGNDAPYVARQLLPAFDKLAGASLRNQAQLRCAAAAVAAERYRLQHGRWLTSLSALTPDLLPKVPRDPFDKQPLRLKRFDQGIVIYSVGADLEDNGGRLTVPKTTAMRQTTAMRPNADIGFRLWDIDKRRQTARELLPVPPREAP